MNLLLFSHYIFFFAITITNVQDNFIRVHVQDGTVTFFALSIYSVLMYILSQSFTSQHDSMTPSSIYKFIAINKSHIANRMCYFYTNIYIFNNFFHNWLYTDHM